MAIDERAEDAAVHEAVEGLVLGPRLPVGHDGPVNVLEAPDPQPALVPRPAPEAATIGRQALLE
jgi:hypothetical protein